MIAPWVWARYPWIKFIGASHGKGLALELNVKARRLITSQWYQRRWGHVYFLTSDQNEKGMFENNKGGFRKVTSVGAGITGSGADIVTADDLLDSQEAFSDTANDAANAFFFDTLYSRLNDQEVGARFVVMQRLSDKDLIAKLREKQADKYNFTVIPAMQTQDVEPKELNAFYRDGLFFPELLSRETLEDIKGNGEVTYSGQYLQSPSPLEGNLFKVAWWKKYRVLPRDFDQEIHSWDFTFEEGEDNSFVVGQVWGSIYNRDDKKSHYYLIYQYRKQMGFVDSLDAFKKVVKMYPVMTKLIEKKANGPAIIDATKEEISGVEAVEPDGNKVQRAIAVSPLVQKGLVHLPDPDLPGNEWVKDYINRFAKFPKCDYDDEIDATSQALRKLHNSFTERFRLLANSY